MAKKYTKKSKKWGKKAGSSGWFKNYRNAGMQLWKDVKYLKSLVNTEFKVKEQSASSTANTTGVFILLNGLTQGDDFTNRNGRSVRWKSLQYHIRTLKDTAVGTCFVNYAIVIDKQANDATPTLADLYSNVQAQFRNLDNRKRFVIIDEVRMTLDADDPERNISKYKKIDMHTIYDASNNGDITDINSNALYLVAWSNQPAGDGADFTLDHRLRFIDN